MPPKSTKATKLNPHLQSYERDIEIIIPKKSDNVIKPELIFENYKSTKKKNKKKKIKTN
tara:strand:+ start:675 stop:851 length:177 start_codon:yes stop_codon:yes gene_type:complete